MNNTGYIYILTDPITNLVRYVGQTTRQPKVRLREHIYKSIYTKNKGTYNSHLSNWIRSISPQLPIISVIHTANTDALDDLEAYYIAHLDNGQLTNDIKYDITTYRITSDVRKRLSEFGRKRNNNVYNVLQYDFNGNFIKEYESEYDAGIQLNIKKSGNIITACKTGISAYGFMWRYKTDESISLKIEPFDNSGAKKCILQYDLKGNFIKEHYSITDAKTDAKIFNNNINLNLRGLRKSAGGFIWKYKDNVISPNITPYDGEIHEIHEILQYGLDGKFINTYKSATEAANISGACTLGLILLCCKEKFKSGGGFIWKFKTSDNFPREINRYEKERHVLTKFVYRKTINGETVQYDSIREAAILNKTNVTILSRKIKKNVSYMGFHWTFTP